MKAAFTLIELLLVIAIIGILAAIAVPNFQQAQVRSKVSRVASDLRTIHLALETYFIDANAYPPNDGLYNVIPLQLTTPVAYLATVKLVDPFSDKEIDPVYGELARYFTYGKVVTVAEWIRDAANGFRPPYEMVDAQGFNLGAAQKYGKWRLVSNGPDRKYSSPAFRGVDPILQGSDILYDPTNGTVSWGNILQTQKMGSIKAPL